MVINNFAGVPNLSMFDSAERLDCLGSSDRGRYSRMVHGIPGYNPYYSRNLLSKCVHKNWQGCEASGSNRYVFSFQFTTP